MKDLKELIQDLENRLINMSRNFEINILWNDIAIIETNERKNDSKDYLLASARQGDRMIAWVNWQDRVLN